MTTAKLRAVASIGAALVIAVGLAACSAAEEPGGSAPAEDTPAAAEDSGAADGLPAGMKRIEPSAEYPLGTCVVSGEELGAMGPPMAFEYEGVEIQLCCESCIEEFAASPEKYVAAVRAASGR